MELAYARRCRASYEKVTEAVERMSAAHGFTICETRDIRAMLAARGFTIAPLTIFEMLPARDSVEWSDLPEVIVRCRVHVAVVGYEVEVGAIRPTALCSALLRGPVEDLMRELDRAVVAFVDDVAVTSDSSST